MDSPVMLDNASKFGRGIDLDCDFPDFNLDEDGFDRRGDLRAHLDDLATRHPVFAGHLLGAPWGDIPFHGTLRGRRRGSGSGNNCQSHQDEDTKSQASGSSAASGASAVSSHGDPEFPETKRNPIPQYGLRNTVDIGQHQTNMDNPQKANRNQRSMSAPPENRQEFQQQAEQPPRFVSRVEITPQEQQRQEQTQREKSPEPQAQQKAQQQQGNVRHIPIFVEGRDEPVISRKRNDDSFAHSSSPPQFQSQDPPNFHRPSNFNERFGRQKWPPHFQETFFDQPRWGREEPERHFPRDWPHHHSQQQFQQPQHQYQQQHQPHQQNQQYHHPENQQHHHPQNPPPQQHQQAPQQQQKQEPEVPKPKQTLPKDPLEKVALVQTEVDSLTEQVKQYTGNSRKDKQYIYLDEMLTRELIKLDDIETEGKENVRLARKTAIKTIQESINLLESKVPLPGQEAQRKQVSETSENTEHSQETEQPEEAADDKPIPLPPGPNCSAPSDDNQTSEIALHPESTLIQDPVETELKIEAPVVESEIQTETKPEEVKNQCSETESVAVATTTTTDVQPSENMEQQTQDVNCQEVQEAPKAAKSPKKVKKTKKQPAPVSMEPIPLPGPKSSDNDAK